MTTIWNLPKIEIRPFQEIDEKRLVLLVTSAPAWEAVKDRLRLSIAVKVEVLRAELSHWQDLLRELREHPASSSVSVIYAIGGGLAADAAKYLAKELNLPLICLPTALSVDAFFTWSAGIRQNGCVRYLETGAPICLIIDFGVLADAPLGLRAAGIADVLSIATGSWDWRFAQERGQNPAGMEYLPDRAGIATAILQSALDCAEAAGRGDPQGLKQLLDCLALEVQLCNLLGHSRPEEGSEHYFAYLAENYVGGGLPHGDLVGPGILIMARLQGQETARLEEALRLCGVPLNRISPAVMRQVLLDLPEYCWRHSLPFGIAHILTTPFVDAVKL